jgi:DNA polymerase-3 subunit delta
MKNIYLITGNSFYLIEDEIKKIVKSNSYDQFDLNDVELKDILEEASYPSMFGDKKYMVIKNANIFGSSRKKKDEEGSSSKTKSPLENYLDNPNPDTVLIFIYLGKADSKKKVVKIIKDEYSFIEVPELKGKELNMRIISDLRNMGYSIDYDTASYIAENNRKNYDLIHNEIDKIDLYYLGGRNLTIDDIKGIVSHTIDDNNFNFVNALVEKNIKKTFKLYEELMIQKVEPIILFSMVSKQFRNMLIYKKMYNELNNEELKKMFGFGFDFQLSNLAKATSDYSVRELEDLLVFSADLDYKIKTGKTSNKLALEILIFEVCK